MTTIDISWNAVEADKNNEITKLFTQIPPCCSTILSDKIPFEPDTSRPYLSTSISSASSPYYYNNWGQATKVFYVEEYNDLFVVGTWQFKATTAIPMNTLGSKIYVFHDFINPHTNQPHINVANSTILSLDVIPNIANLAGTGDATRVQQLIFWQHGCLWQLYPDIQAVSSGSAFTGKLVRFTYDGIKLTKAQTISVGLGSRYGAYALTQKLPIAFDLLRNDLIWCGGFSGSSSGTGDNAPHGWTSGVIIHIKEDTANDTFTADVIHLQASSLIGTTKDYLKMRIDCVYLTQIHRWAYLYYGYSNSGTNSYNKNDRCPFMINLSVNSSNISDFETSLNTQSNWISITNPYLLADYSSNGININQVETVLNENNETVLLLLSENAVFWADTIEQLQGTQQWNYSTSYATKTKNCYSIGNRLVFMNFNTSDSFFNPSNGDRYNSQYDYPTAESTKYFIVSWTENGKDYYTKRIKNGLAGHCLYVYQGSTDEIDSINTRQLILDRYVITWIQLPGDDWTNQNTNPYGKLVIIDLEKRI